MSRRRRVLPILCAIFAWALLSSTPSGHSAERGGQSGGAGSSATGATILGSVVDASLTPLSGVVVTLERDGSAQGKVTTGKDGTFRFANVAAGTYRIRAERTGFPVLSRDLRVPAGVTTVRMPIVMVRPTDAVLEVKAEDRALSRQSATAQALGVTSPPPMPMPPATTLAMPPGPPSGASAAQVAGGGGGRGGARPPTAVPAESPQMLDRLSSAERETPWSGYRYGHSGARYAHVPPNQFQSALNQPLSTFGADVDTASYANVRRLLSSGQLPPRDAVRVEEFVNYFRFDYDVPRDGRPLAITTEVGDCPWAPTHKLVLVGARAMSAPSREIAGRNIVLLLDVSGSMSPLNRLPLIQSGLRMFVDTLRGDDRLAIVTYAGSSGLALPSTPISRRDVIQRAIANLSAGGSTNGAQGLITAYRVAREAFIPGGVNRVILATDGDFNVGVVNQRDLLHLIEQERESGVFLSVLGVGDDNLNDATMEMLADRGNGNYAYLDSLQEARRVLVRESDSTLETVAKDVKFQVEFNPAMVSAWKLIGYENRLMAAQDFNDDRKDGGEMGAGHTVTVLYEVIPIGVEGSGDDRSSGGPTVDPLKYQAPAQPAAQVRPAAPVVARPGEWLTVKARYKAPEGETSQLITRPVLSGGGVRHLPLASAVAEFGLLLRSGGSTARWDALVARAGRLQVPASQSVDLAGFSELVAIGRGLSNGGRGR
jgi:Ca-activated chloride channel family protein